MQFLLRRDWLERPSGLAWERGIKEGFADSAVEVTRCVESLAVDGINIEDSTIGQLVDPALHAAMVAATASVGLAHREPA